MKKVKRSNSNNKHKIETNWWTQKSVLFWSKIVSVFFIVAAVIVVIALGIYYSHDRFMTGNKGGAYQAQLVLDNNDTLDSSQTQSKLKTLTSMMTNWIDPTDATDLDVQTMSNSDNSTNSIVLNAGKDFFGNQQAFLSTIERQGHLFLLDDQGRDLLTLKYDKDKKANIEDTKRIPISDVIDSISYRTQISASGNIPTISINFKKVNKDDPDANKNLKQFYEVVDHLDDKSSSSANAGSGDKKTEVYLWADYDSFLNQLRFDTSAFGNLKILVQNNPGKGLRDLFTLTDETIKYLKDTYGFTLHSQYKSSFDLDPDNYASFDDAINHNEVHYKSTFNDLKIDPNNPSWTDSDIPEAIKNWPQFLPQAAGIKGLDPKKDDTPETPEFINKSHPGYNTYYLALTNASDIKKHKITISDLNAADAQKMNSLLTASTKNVNFKLGYYGTVDAVWDQAAITAIIVVLAVMFALAAIFLVGYYRMFGLVAVFSIIAVVAGVFAAFTYLGGYFGPETLVTMVVMLGLIFDVVVSFLERIKQELSHGRSIFNSFKAGNRKSLSTVLDASVTSLIAVIALFWLAFSASKGFSITAIITVVCVMIFSILAFRLLMALIIRFKWVQNLPLKWIIGAPKVVSQPENIFESTIAEIAASTETTAESAADEPEKMMSLKTHDQKLIAQIKAAQPIKKTSSAWERFAGHKSSRWIASLNQRLNWRKWWLLLPLVVVIVGAILFGTIGPNTDSHFAKGSNINLVLTTSAESPSVADYKTVATEVEGIIKDQAPFNDKIFDYEFVLNLSTDTSSSYYNGLVLHTSVTNPNTVDDLINWIRNNNDLLTKIDTTITSTLYFDSNNLAQSTAINTVLSFVIMFIAVGIYMLIRFGWTYTFSLLASLIAIIFVSLAVGTIVQVPFGIGLAPAILGIAILATNFFVMLLDQWRELIQNFHDRYPDRKVTTAILAKIAVTGLKRLRWKTVVTTAFMVVFGIVLSIAVPGALDVGLMIIIGTIVTLFMAYLLLPLLWIWLSNVHYNRAHKITHKIEFKLEGPDETLVKGINS